MAQFKNFFWREEYLLPAELERFLDFHLFDRPRRILSRLSRDSRSDLSLFAIEPYITTSLNFLALVDDITLHRYFEPWPNLKW